MNHASLFSGIGGAELAASWVGWNNVFHCDINEFGNKVVKYHFPESKKYGDITKTDFREWNGTIDVLTGGFPCQPFSIAGKRKGKEDDRYLWPEMLRVIREIQPAWVVGENVGGIVSMVQPSTQIEMGCEASLFEEDYYTKEEQEYVVETVCKSLECEGYSVQPLLIPACAVGAPHRRDRIWFVAHRTDARSKSQQVRKELSDKHGLIADARLQRPSKSKEQQMGFEQLCKGEVTTDADNTRNIARKYDININESEKVQRSKSQSEFTGCSSERVATYTKSEQGKWMQSKQSEISKSESGKLGGNDSKKYFERNDWSSFPTQSPICNRDDGLSDRLVGISFPKWRNEAIKAMGNSWVPQVAYQIFKVINQIENETEYKRQPHSGYKSHSLRVHQGWKDNSFIG